MEKLYKPNEFYNIMGITRETMRHYLDKGLIFPAYTNEKGYSFYGEEQMLQMMIIRYYRNCELTVNELKAFLWDMDLPSQIQELDLALSNLDDQIQSLQTKRNLLAKRRYLMYASKEHLNKPFLDTIGREMYLLNIAQTMEQPDPYKISVIRELALKFPSAHISLMADWNDFMKKQPMKTQLGYGIIEKEDLEEFPLDLFCRIPAHKCLVTRVCVKNPLLIQPEDLKPLYEKIEKEHFEVVGGVYGHLLSIEKKEDTFYYYITMRVHLK